MSDRDRKKKPDIGSNAPNITDQTSDDENEKDIQEVVRDILETTEKEMEKYANDPDSDELPSNAPNITENPDLKEDKNKE